MLSASSLTRHFRRAPVLAPGKDRWDVKIGTDTLATTSSPVVSTIEQLVDLPAPHDPKSRTAAERVTYSIPCTITDIPDEEVTHLSENGTKAWEPNTQTITVTPPEPVVVPDPSPDPRGVAFQALINTATSPEQAAAIEQVAAALGIVVAVGG